MKRYLLLFCLIIFSQVFSQGTFVDMVNMKPGTNYPNDMPVIKKWITDAIGYIPSRGNSYSVLGPDSFFIGTEPIVLNFSGTGGIKLIINVESKNKNTTPISINTSLPILNFDRQFNPAELKYTAREYFDVFANSAFVTSFELINGALNSLPGKCTEDRALVFIDSINSFYHKSIPYPEKKNHESLIDVFNKNRFKRDLFYDMFVKADTNEESIKKLNRFFKWVHPLTEDMTTQIDELRILSIEVGMNPYGILEFPATILQTNASQNKKTALKYQCSTINATLDYKNKCLTIKLKDNKRPPITLVNALKSRVSTVQTATSTTTTQEWIPVKNEAISVEEFIILVTENSVTVSAKGNASIYKLVENKNN